VITDLKQVALVLKEEKKEEKPEELEQKSFEIDLDDSYEDSDFEKPQFDSIDSLLTFINSIEDDNLFKIKLLEQEEMQLDRIIRDKQLKITEVKESAQEVDKNIEGFNKTRQ
jgi:hypothetical protein